MSVWNYLTPQNLIDFQRANAIRDKGKQAQKLLREGYAAEANSLLDEISAMPERWEARP